MSKTDNGYSLIISPLAAQIVIKNIMEAVVSW